MSVGIYRIKYLSTDITNDRELTEKMFDRFGKDDGETISMSWEDFKEWFAEEMEKNPEIYYKNNNEGFWIGITREFEKIANEEYEKTKRYYDEHPEASPFDALYLELYISW